MNFEQKRTKEDIQNQRRCLPLAGCIVANELDHLPPVLDLSVQGDEQLSDVQTKH